jgi:hypothetical protein
MYRDESGRLMNVPSIDMLARAIVDAADEGNG